MRAKSVAYPKEKEKESHIASALDNTQSQRFLKLEENNSKLLKRYRNQTRQVERRLSNDVLEKDNEVVEKQQAVQ